jgi:AraC-like DNA-binding protein
MPVDHHISTHARSAVLVLQQYMDKHPMAHKTCDDLWDNVDTSSRSAVEMTFKQVTGYGIKEYLVFVRLEHSKQLLKEGMQVKRVAVKALYRSQSAYCTAFKRYFNVSPTDWLKKVQ